MKLFLYGILAGLILLPGNGYAAFDHSHAQWEALLQTHVQWVSNGNASRVDYSGFKRDLPRLEIYLKGLSGVSSETFQKWNSKEQLSFLINAYNAFTVRLILTEYPDLESIKDLGSLFSSPWKKRFFVLLGEKKHLDGIEHDIIRKPGSYDDPRIHMAVNCAAIGCPALRKGAYTYGSLEDQFDDSTRRYLSDRSRNRYDPESHTVYAGKIFDWYREDFQKGDLGIDSLEDFLKRYADSLADTSGAVNKIRKGGFDIRFTEYDWRLNDTGDLDK